MHKGGSIYILTNKHHTVLYVGVSSNLERRVSQHRAHFYKNSFSARYNLEKLVYYEGFDRIEEAIARETEIKKWSRKKKEVLINDVNAEWRDLYEELFGV